MCNELQNPESKRKLLKTSSVLLQKSALLVNKKRNFLRNISLLVKGDSICYMILAVNCLCVLKFLGICAAVQFNSNHRNKLQNPETKRKLLETPRFLLQESALFGNKKQNFCAKYFVLYERQKYLFVILSDCLSYMILSARCSKDSW